MSLKVEKPAISAHEQIERERERERETKCGFWATTGSTGAAYLGYRSVKKYGKNFQNKVSNNIMKESLFSSYILNGKNCRNLFKASGLKDKGIKIVDCANKSASVNSYFEVPKIITNFVKGKESFSKFIGIVNKLQLDHGRNAVIEGSNAFFFPNNKKIFYNGQLLGMSLPHEMGHAMNSTTFIGKTLQKSRGVSLLALPILAIAILRRPTEKKGKSETAVGKSLDFIKDNCVALTAATQVPLLLEEGMASIKAAKLCKKFLDPIKTKAINTLNGKAFLTYLTVAGITIAGVWVANKIRNWTAKDTTNPTSQKEEQEQQQNITKREITTNRNLEQLA